MDIPLFHIFKLKSYFLICGWCLKKHCMYNTTRKHNKLLHKKCNWLKLYLITCCSHIGQFFSFLMTVAVAEHPGSWHEKWGRQMNLHSVNLLALCHQNIWLSDCCPTLIRKKTLRNQEAQEFMGLQWLHSGNLKYKQHRFFSEFS